MSSKDTPIVGLAIASALLCAIIGIGAWQYLSAATAPPPVDKAVPTPSPATPPAEIAFDKNRAFPEFQARLLGLPTVWTYPSKK